MKHALVHDPEALPPWPVLVGFLLFCASVSFIVLLFTPLTYQLDDIKTFGLYAGGGLCLLAWSILWLLRHVPSPPQLVWIPYAAYLGGCVLSTLFAADFARWIGFQYCPYYLSTLGFVLLGSGVVQTRRMADWSLRFWVLLTLITTGFGMLHYAGFFEIVYKHLYPKGQPLRIDQLHDLIYTFVQARSMLSTVLNVQFFGNFLLMLLPVAAASALVLFRDLNRRLTSTDARGAAKNTGFHIGVDIGWLVIAGLGIVLAIACIFTTYSKSSIFGLPVVFLLFFAGLYLFVGARRIPYLWLMIACGLVMAATLFVFVSGDLRDQLKDVDESLGPRRIIYQGALAIFSENPILGGGPGSFRILFPEHRSPDYHLNRVSNLTLYAHNWILDLLAETGLLGTLTYLAFLGGIFWIGLRALRQSSDATMRVAVLGCGVGIISILAGAMLTPMTRWPVGTGSLHAMLGTFLGIAVMTLRPPDPLRRGIPVYTWKVPAITWDAWQLARSAIVVLLLLYVPIITYWSARVFSAAVYHKQAWRKTDFPADSIEHYPDLITLLHRGAADFEQALELDPTRLTTYYRLAHVYNRLGRQDKALETYIKLMEYAPDYSEVHYNMGVLYYNLAADAMEGKNPDATEPEAITELFRKSAASFDRAAKLSNKVNVVYYQGLSHYYLAAQLAQDSPEARDEYLKAADSMIRASRLPLSTVIQEIDQRELEEGLRFEAIKMAPQCFAMAGKPLRAAEAAEEYLSWNPTSIRALREAADFYVAADRYHQAMRLIEERIEKNPFNPNAWLVAIDVSEAAGYWPDAARMGEIAIRMEEQLRQSGSSMMSDASLEALAARTAAAAEKAIEADPLLGESAKK